MYEKRKGKKELKKFLLMLLMLVLVGGVLVACGSDVEQVNSSDTKETETDKEKPKEENKEEKPEDKIYKIGDTIKVDGLEVTLSSVKFVAPAEYSPSENGKVVVAEITAKNAGETDSLIDNIDFTIADTEGNQYSEYYGFDDAIFTHDLKPGNQVKGKVAFDVAETDKYIIYYEPSLSFDPVTIKFEVTAAEMQ